MFTVSKVRHSMGEHAFCVCCREGVGPRQRMRMVDGLPVHLACYRRIVRDSTQRELQLAAVTKRMKEMLDKPQ